MKVLCLVAFLGGELTAGVATAVAVYPVIWELVCLGLGSTSHGAPSCLLLSAGVGTSVLLSSSTNRFSMRSGSRRGGSWVCIKETLFPRVWALRALWTSSRGRALLGGSGSSGGHRTAPTEHSPLGYWAPDFHYRAGWLGYWASVVPYRCDSRYWLGQYASASGSKGSLSIHSNSLT